MTNWLKRSGALALAMFSAAILAGVLTPTIRAVDRAGKLNLEERLPHAFGAWRLDSVQTVSVVNPQQAEVLETIYSQTVSKTYVNTSGQRIMLSIAYGEDQSRSNQLHKPETCYEAQGFSVRGSTPILAATRFGQISATRLIAVQNARHEPITYWMRVGDVVVRGGLAQAIERARAGLLRHEIPDGLLFRVSTITSDPRAAYELHEAFIRDLLDAVDPEMRWALIGRLAAGA